MRFRPLAVSRPSRFLLVFLALTLAAADPSTTDWLRLGNAAYSRGDYQEALRCFEQVEASTTDPGQLAFNRAACFYQMDRFSEAVQDYERSLADATGARRMQALYGLANAKVRAAEKLDRRAAERWLKEAIEEHYEECLRLDPAFADAAANRQTAQRLLAKRQAEPAPTMGNGQDTNPNQGTNNTQNPGMGDMSPNTSNPDPSGGTTETASDQPRPFQPGSSQLPLLLKDKNAPIPDAVTAQAYLQTVLPRLRAEQANRRPTGKAASGDARDY